MPKCPFSSILVGKGSDRIPREHSDGVVNAGIGLMLYMCQAIIQKDDRSREIGQWLLKSPGLLRTNMFCLEAKHFETKHFETMM